MPIRWFKGVPVSPIITTRGNVQLAIKSGVPKKTWTHPTYHGQMCSLISRIQLNDMEVSINGGTPKWMVYKGKSQ